MTIGAVSAAENITQNDAVTAMDDSSDCSVGKSYDGNDFYITVKENYTQDRNDWNSDELIYISSYSQDNGTFSILVDDVEKQSFNVTNGYFSIEDNGYGGTYEKYFAQIYPADLDMDLGSYNVNVKFNQKTLIDTQVTLKEKEDFNVYMQNPYYCMQEYWSSPSFIIIDSNHLNTGTLEILVNGNRKISYVLNNGDFEEIPDCSNKSRYLAASDLFDGYGTYDVKITFTQDGITKTLRDESVVVAEREPTTNPKVELYFDLYTVNLPVDNKAYIYLPWEATGTLNIRFNNVDENIIYSNGRAEREVYAWELNHLGENKVTVTYTGDDFGTLTATETVIVVPTITAPFFVSENEKFTIKMCTHEWVNGNFNVYDYNSGKKGKLLASSTIKNRYSSVELSSDIIGLNKYYLEFDYPGGDYPIIQDVYVVKNSDRISANVSDNVGPGSDVTVDFRAPATPFGFVYISVDGGANEFYSMESGRLTRAISGLSTGYHIISVQYNDGYFENGKLLGDVYSKTFNVSVGEITKLTAPSISTTYNNAKNLVITLKDAKGNVLAGKNVTVVLNGKTYERTSDNSGQVKLSVKLPAKSYVAAFSFAGDDTYLKSSGSAKVVVKKATPIMTASSKTFKVKAKTKRVTVTLKNNKKSPMKKTKVTLTVNKKTYKIKTTTKGVATFTVKLTKKGKYTAVYKYAGSSNYKAVSKKVKITVK